MMSNCIKYCRRYIVNKINRYHPSLNSSGPQMFQLAIGQGHIATNERMLHLSMVANSRPDYSQHHCCLQATTVIVSMPPGHCLCALEQKNFQFPHTCRVPLTKKKIPWYPCPLTNEAYMVAILIKTIIAFRTTVNDFESQTPSSCLWTHLYYNSA